MEDVPVKSHSARPALGSLAMLWRFARRYPGRIAGALLALIVSSAATLAIPNGFRLVIDKGFMGGGDISRWFEYLLLIVLALMSQLVGQGQNHEIDRFFNYFHKGNRL